MLIFDILSVVFSVVAFIIGTLYLFNKGKPLYFQLLICAVGCFALGQIANLISYFCGWHNENTVFSTSEFCYFGIAAFTLTANVGVLDKSIYKELSKKMAGMALITPAIYLALLLFFVISAVSSDPLYGIANLIILSPSVVCCYHNQRHLLTKPDEKGILRSIRATDIISIAFAFTSLICLLLYWYEFSLLSDITEVAISLIAFSLVIASIKGAKSWKI